MKHFINEALENSKFLSEEKNRLAKKETDKINSVNESKSEFKNKYFAIREMKERKNADRSKLLEAARNDALATVINAIYITALEAATLADENIILAESMTNNWIKENGGASAILGRVGNKTYLLSRITQIVEDAAEETVNQIENPEDDKYTTVKRDIAVAAAKEFIKTADKAQITDFVKQILEPSTDDSSDDNEDLSVPEDDNDDNDTKSDDVSFDDSDDDDDTKDNSNDENNNDEKSNSEDDETQDNSNDENDDDTDDDDEDLGEPLDDDGVDQDTTVDGTTDNKGKIFDDLEKEEDVQKAIDVIRNRIADAEETFIKNNAEDKKKIEDILSKISNNVKTVEDLKDKDPDKAEVAQESARMYKRAIDSIKENKPLTIFEKMTRNLTKSIIMNESVKEKYLTEDGNIDTDLLVESAKVMYGFLETLNTLQLEKVDKDYIKNILTEMK